MPQTIYFRSSPFPRDTIVQSVALKRLWNEPWTTIPHLFADRITWECAPALPTAQLYWRYGEGYLPGEQAFREIAPLVGRGQNFVRVTCSTVDGDQARWYGTLEVDGRELDGTREELDVAGNLVLFPTGKQGLVCYGLEFLLETTFIYESNFLTPTGSFEVSRRGLTFNADGLPNRTVSMFGDTYLFKARSDVRGMEPSAAASTLQSQVRYWSTRDCVEYLLTYHAPYDGLGLQRFPLRLAGSALAVLPAWDRPILETHGKRLSELLSQLIPRQRLLGWFLEVVAGAGGGANETVDLEAFSFAEQPIRLEEAGTARIPPNPEQRLLVFDYHAGSAHPVTKTSTLDAVNEVRASGGRRRSCLSTWAYDGTSFACWSYDQQQRYCTGASGSAGYPAAEEIAERQRLNREARAVDALADVFCHFGFNLLDFKTRSAEAGDQYPVAPDDADDTALPIYMPEVVTLRTIPFAEPGSDRERAPFVLAKLSGDRYAFLDRYAAVADLEKKIDAAGRKWSAHVQVPPREFGLTLRVSGGPGQHVFASADFVAVDSSDTLDNVPSANWREFIFTFAIEEDRHCEVVWPIIAEGSPIRQMHLPCGDNYRLDYVVPRTVIGVDAATGELVRHAGGIVRDDRPVLLRVARLAYEWYKSARTSIEFETTQFRSPDDLWLGHLITGIGDPDVAGAHQMAVNAVVTQIELTFPRGPVGPGLPTARAKYNTQYGQLDPLRIVI